MYDRIHNTLPQAVITLRLNPIYVIRGFGFRVDLGVVSGWLIHLRCGSYEAAGGLFLWGLCYRLWITALALAFLGVSIWIPGSKVS